MYDRKFICNSALATAENCVRRKENSFIFEGVLFVLEWLSDREAVVFSSGKDAGIRIYAGIAMLF